MTAISGLGSVAHWREHAADTARAVSEMKPDYLGLLTLMVEPGTPLEAWVREGSFTLLSPLEVLEAKQSCFYSTWTAKEPCSAPTMPATI